MNRKFQARVECLEAREVLSTTHAAVHIMASSAGSLQGKGNIQIISERMLPDGELEAQDNLQGTARGLGHYTGQLDISLDSGQRHLSGTGNLVTSAGRINFTFSGSYTPPRGHSATAHGQFTATFQGGTNAYVNASGSGVFMFTNNVNNGTAVYTANGRIRT